MHLFVCICCLCVAVFVWCQEGETDRRTDMGREEVLNNTRENVECIGAPKGQESLHTLVGTGTEPPASNLRWV